MTTKKAASKSNLKAVPAQSRDLTTKSILAFSSQRTPIELPGDEPDSVYGVVYLRRLTARDAMSFAEKAKGEEGSSAMYGAVSRFVVDGSGAALFTEEQAAELPAQWFMLMSKAIAEAMGVEVPGVNAAGDGNPFEEPEASGAASPTG